MGLYPINCTACSKPFMWFSGTMDQRCEACKNPRIWFLQTHTDPGHPSIAIEVQKEQQYEDDIKVIEYSAFEFQCRQVEKIANDYNKLSAKYMALLDGKKHDN